MASPKKDGIVPKVISMIDQILAFRNFQKLPDEKREELNAEIDTLRRLALVDRAPRLTVLRSKDMSLTDLLEGLVGKENVGDIETKTKLGRGRWFEYELKNGPLDVLDLCADEEETLNLNALDRKKPDLIICLPDREEPKDENLRSQLEDVVREVESIWGGAPSILIGSPEVEAGIATSELYEFFRRDPSESSIPYQCLHAVAAGGDGTLADGVVLHAPLETQLRFARLADSNRARRRVADRLVRASSGLAGTIATVPVPFADIIPITGIQIVMIGTIARISGKPFNLKTLGQFLGAMGVNVGAGLTFRKIVRTLVQLIPFAGSVVSAAIASGGTYGLGRMATLYFIDDSK